MEGHKVDDFRYTPTPVLEVAGSQAQNVDDVANWYTFFNTEEVITFSRANGQVADVNSVTQEIVYTTPLTLHPMPEGVMS